MSSEVVIRAWGLGKQYRIGGNQQRYRTFREVVTSALVSPFARMARLLRGELQDASELEESFWALRDLDFEVRRGEVIGVIGRNGAGKSTLLRILSRITEPTEGRAEIHGRVGSLLEVGTGFHPELTGYENIYLNGAILGMPRAEIERKLDAIVDFAGVSRFLDTPVKHYSTGMYLRLAFSVAAHLDPEILLVDEVLAVGDVEFQKKCLGKMDEVAHKGRTVLFVSHNLAAVRSLCQQGLVLDAGKKTFFGPVAQAIRIYAERRSEQAESRGSRFGSFSDLALDGESFGSIRGADAFEVTGRLTLHEALPAFQIYFSIFDADGNLVAQSVLDDHTRPELCQPGSFELRLVVPPLWLQPGLYNLRLKLLGSALSAGAARIGSDELALDVAGEVATAPGQAYLAPEVDWHVASPRSL